MVRGTVTNRFLASISSTTPAVAPDQRTLRPDPPVRGLEEFLRFLEEIEAVAGPIPHAARPIVGTRFLL